ncbi:hypothetical protein [Methylophilus aquaticus]|uniref:Uncharacterized protein n=1 Tax=Methylophilus aquaticus TaxID=1971610 RepID=A0ABT9JQG8_9PROT|nr:hypothetical protein [Methylophilus aquaticus]MDP8566807.1 hypothetical protein [Methylophilus aquaticus]
MHYKGTLQKAECRQQAASADAAMPHSKTLRSRNWGAHKKIEWMPSDCQADPSEDNLTWFPVIFCGTCQVLFYLTG